MTKTLRTLITKSAGHHFFSSQHQLKTHSSEHLELQKKIFDYYRIPVKQTFLSEGSILMGLNITRIQPYYLSTTPVYHPDTFSTLSKSELKELQDLAQHEYAQVGEYELLSDLHCLCSNSEHGLPIYYIDKNYFSVLSYTPLERLIKSDHDKKPSL